MGPSDFKPIQLSPLSIEASDLMLMLTASLIPALYRCTSTQRDMSGHVSIGSIRSSARRVSELGIYTYCVGETGRCCPQPIIIPGSRWLSMVVGGGAA
jgi:hypothetical protein